jgi:hypothetical protein
MGSLAAAAPLAGEGGVETTPVRNDDYFHIHYIFL